MYIYKHTCIYIYIYTRVERALRARIGPWALGPGPWALPWALGPPLGPGGALRGSGPAGPSPGPWWSPAGIGPCGALGPGGALRGSGPGGPPTNT